MEISYKDRIVGVNAGRGVIMIVNKDVENSPEQKSCWSPAPGIHSYLCIQNFS